MLAKKPDIGVYTTCLGVFQGTVDNHEDYSTRKGNGWNSVVAPQVIEIQHADDHRGWTTDEAQRTFKQFA